MAKDFVIYKVHIHKVNHGELYTFLENMTKSTRGLFIREAIEHYGRTTGLLGDKPKARAMDVSLRGTFDQDFGGAVGFRNDF